MPSILLAPVGGGRFMGRPSVAPCAGFSLFSCLNHGLTPRGYNLPPA